MSKELNLEIYDIVKIMNGVGSIWIESISKMDKENYYTKGFKIDKQGNVESLYIKNINDAYQLEFVWRLDDNRNYIMIYPIQRLEAIDKKRCGANVEKVIIDEFVPSKDLEKEYLEDLDHYDEGMGIHSTSYEKCKERLIRLAKIDNANPSEALEGLKSLDIQVRFIGILDVPSWEKYLPTIKQALLKEQENEKVLEIIKEKPLSLIVFKLYKTYDKDGLVELNYKSFVDCQKEITEDLEEELKEPVATEQEFDLLKRYFG